MEREDVHVALPQRERPPQPHHHRPHPPPLLVLLVPRGDHLRAVVRQHRGPRERRGEGTPGPRAHGDLHRPSRAVRVQIEEGHGGAELLPRLRRDHPQGPPGARGRLPGAPSPGGGGGSLEHPGGGDIGLPHDPELGAEPGRVGEPGVRGAEAGVREADPRRGVLDEDADAGVGAAAPAAAAEELADLEGGPAVAQAHDRL